MGKIIEGDDGLPAEEVGPWAKEKHEYLCRYIDISRAVRQKWLGDKNAGATFIDLFCGPVLGAAKFGEPKNGLTVESLLLGRKVWKVVLRFPRYILRLFP